MAMKVLQLFFILFVSSTIEPCTCASLNDNKDNFAVVIDAGSSGTRLWVYKWSGNIRGKMLPKYRSVLNKKAKPGLSTYSDDRDELIQTVLNLLEPAKREVPEYKRLHTPIYLLATAGMRFLLEEKANKVFQDLDGILKNHSLNPFLYTSPHNARILSGEEEGVFAWIAVNYLAGVFGNGAQPVKTYGILELGGASTQITFVPRSNILADKFPVTILGQKYPLYAHSYLYFGQDYVDLWVMEHLEDTHPNQTNMINPCLLSGDQRNLSSGLAFTGSGDPHQCAHIIGHLVHKINPRFCNPKPCAIGAVYQPTIHADQTFYALSVLPLIFKELDILDTDNTFTPASVFEKANEYCKKDYSIIKAKVIEKRWQFISKPCVMGIYIGLLLTKGYGFKNQSKQIIGVDEINNVTADWTLGALIYEQASDSSCPEILPVGGSGSSIRPNSIFISVLQLPFHPHSFFPFLQMTFFPAGSQPAVAILIYLVLGAIFEAAF